MHVSYCMFMYQHICLNSHRRPNLLEKQFTTGKGELVQGKTLQSCYWQAYIQPRLMGRLGLVKVLVLP